MSKLPLLTPLLLVPVAGWMCVPKENPPTKTPSASVPEQVQRRINVTQFYDDTCSKCHGAKGEGGGGGTKTLLTKDLFDQKHDRRFYDAISNGVPDMGMEGYKSTLSGPDIWALVVHIRELQAKALRAEFGSPKAVDGVYKGTGHNYRIETVVDTGEGLKTPWAVDWLPDGQMIVTNRPGTVHLAKGGKLGPAIEGIPASVEIGQGGMMDVAVHPDYAKNGWIYLAFTDPAEGGRGGMTKIVRGKLKLGGSAPQWVEQLTIYQNAPDTYNGSGVHFGSRIVFDGKGHVFFCIGERGNGNLSQDLTKPNGKIFRVKEDGTIPSDNPFADAASKAKGYLPAIWSYGHRNPQGLTQDLDGALWDTEHAPRGGDEVNRVVKAKNYGWPIISFGINYNDSPLALPWPGPGQDFAMPVFRWLPSIGACGLDTIRGAAFPNWKNDLVAGGLSGANVDRLRIRNNQLVEREELVHGMGRVRDTVVGPDGSIYVVLNQPDKIIRLVPAK